jgi:hypothetical protein
MTQFSKMKEGFVTKMTMALRSGFPASLSANECSFGKAEGKDRLGINTKG